jgi:uncharacterized membrane protein
MTPLPEHRGREPLPSDGRLHFNALITPHRSLGRKGFLVVMGIVIGINFLSGVLFALKGAWLVAPFCGLDVALVWWAFRANYRAARAHETVQLSDDELIVRHVDQYGRAKGYSFEPYWVRLDLKENPDETTELRLRSHGRELEIASFLSVPERADFANALTKALREWRAVPEHAPLAQ